jgi:hypothetical protein
VRFSGSTARVALFLLCLVAVPHPFCYSLDTKKEMDDHWEFDFKKNTFFLDCDAVTYMPFTTDKDIVVIIDGDLYAHVKVDEVCPK